MSRSMLLVYEEEIDPAVQAEREQELPMFVELHRRLRRPGCWWASSGCMRLTARRRSACATDGRRSSMARSR